MLCEVIGQHIAGYKGLLQESVGLPTREEYHVWREKDRRESYRVATEQLLGVITRIIIVHKCLLFDNGLFCTVDDCSGE